MGLISNQINKWAIKDKKVTDGQILDELSGTGAKLTMDFVWNESRVRDCIWIRAVTQTT